jgi:hypothetical protein
MRRMSLALVLALLCLLFAADAMAGKRFATHFACNPFRARDADTVCYIGDLPATVLIARRSDRVRYKVCIKQPDGDRDCRGRRTGRKGHPSTAAFRIDATGIYTATWFVHGSRIDRDHLRVRGENARLQRLASTRSCRPVVNPYAGTRYEGVNLSRIRASGVTCRIARRVARRAHRKALAMAPSPNGFLRFNWHHWRVVGDLRPPSDRYVATRDGKQVRWRF